MSSSPMRNRERWQEIGFYLLICIAFVAANFGAYHGYFSDDDFDNIAMNRNTGWDTPLQGLLSTKLTPVYRPMGALWQLVTGTVFDLHFLPYVLAIQCLHLLNLVLLWLFLRRAGLPMPARFAGILFYAFHFAAVAAYWQPMYVFDVLCALFCQLTLVLYQRGRILTAFIAFWLAYKSKEVAILLPIALLAYEHWMGERRWWRTAPFFLVPVIFGTQALFRHAPQNDYSLVYAPSSIVKSASFYVRQLTGVWSAVGLVLLLLATRMGSPLVNFGLATSACLLVPMLLVPGRLNSVYWYVPLVGIAFVVAELARRWPRFVLAAFLLWLPWNNHFLRIYRRIAAPQARINHDYVNALQYTWNNYYGPRVKNVIIDGRPPTFNRWGVDGALRLISHDFDFKIHHWSEDPIATGVHDPSTLQLTWNRVDHRLSYGTPTALANTSYVDMPTQSPGLAITDGWHPVDGPLRWADPAAHATLLQNSTTFALIVVPPEYQVKVQREIEVHAVLDGVDLGTQTITKPGRQTLKWKAPPGDGKTRNIELRITPPFRPNGNGTRPLGIPVTAIGFVPDATSEAGTPRPVPDSTAR